MNKPCGRSDHHNAHSWADDGSMEWCDGDGVPSVDDSLLAALKVAAAENTQGRPCRMCVALEKMSDPVRGAVEAALGGTIGRDKLVSVLAAHGYDVGRRAIERHRQEGHS